MSALIVCATDFSPRAEAALAWAAAFARREGAHLDLLHVVRPYHDDSRMLVFDAMLVDDELVRAAGERLEGIARETSRDFGVSVRSEVLRGLPHEEILAHARRHGARFVALGTSGLAAIERWMLGSVAERAVRAADRPIVLVPRLQEPNPWRSEASRPPRVVAGVGAPDDVSVLRFVASLRHEAACDVTCVRLYWPLVEYARLGLEGPRDPLAVDREVVENLAPPLRRQVAALPGRGKVDLDIRPAWGDTTANLLVAVEDHEADLLVVGVERRRGIQPMLSRSIAERLARGSRYVPVACVPVERSEAPLPLELPKIHTVLAVTDFSDLGNSAVPHAYSLVRAGGTVELCHVHERPLPSPSFAYDVPSKHLSDVERERLAKDLRALVPAEAAALGIATHVSIIDGGRAAQAIVQASERLDVDAICLASHGRTGIGRTVLGSVAAEVIHRARLPVLVVRRR